jgi:uncharacterized protein (TIGR02391 family)
MRMTKSGPVDPQELRTLPVGEVAIRLLRQLAKGEVTSSNNVFRGAEQAYQYNGEPDVAALLERLSDAWAWLVAHGLLGPAPTQTGDWMRLTRRGRDVASRDDAVVVVQAEDRVSFELHPLLEAKVRPVFMLGDYETAAFAAMKQVEVRVRELSGEVADVVGVALMRKAFGERGPLTDQAAPRGEQVAVMDLFAGAIGTVKNPASHRTVDYEDPAEAAEAVLMADLLMRMLDRVGCRAG